MVHDAAGSRGRSSRVRGAWDPLDQNHQTERCPGVFPTNILSGTMRIS
jgi:hypothetical protein